MPGIESGFGLNDLLAFGAPRGCKDGVVVYIFCFEFIGS